MAAEFAKALGCKSNGRYYTNGDYVITNCIGHLYRLWEPGDYDEKWKKWSLEKLPIIPGTFNYTKNVETASQADVVDRLLKAHHDKDILIATDAGREGELIARIVLEEAGIKDVSHCRRFWVSEALTPEVIKKGIVSAKKLSDYDKTAAQGYARQHADWLIGMNLSRFVTLGSRSGEKFNVGRVQSSLLASVVLRHERASHVISTPYQEGEITMRDGRGTQVKAVLQNPETNKSGFAVKSPYLLKALDYVKTHNKGNDLDVTVESTKKALKPEKLYNLTTLQKEAFRLYEFSPDETLKIAQSLYEKHKCLSYPRTPSRVMGDNNVGLFREKYELFKDQYPQWSQYSKAGLITEANRHIFNSAALEDHHALIPTACIPEGASSDEKKVFEIVVKSFFMVCMADYTWNEHRYTIRCGVYLFKAATKETLHQGWKQVTKDKSGDEQEIPESGLLDTKSCHITSAVLVDKKTAPPRNFQMNTLLAFMERPQAQAEERAGGKLAGLGTPATRAEIIKNLMDSHYMVEEKKHITPTPKGIWLIQRLKGNRELSRLAKVRETTAWETELECDPRAFEQSIISYIKHCVRHENLQDGAYEREGVGKCPLCGNEIYEGKKSFFCSSWNDAEKPCKFTLWKSVFGTQVTGKDVKLLLAMKKTGVKDCMSKEGKKYKALLFLDREGKVKLEFKNTGHTGKKEYKKGEKKK